ncbi:MAG: LuxR family transcriptional regulator [Actinobacteria bacterium]|nr:LuxR family transcriptional regulator [Actinomycetota bacterium]
MSQVVDSLDVAREASARFAWRQAYEAYGSVDLKDLTPDDLERFGEAAWWSGKLDDAIKQRERSYAGFSAAGDKMSTARLALNLAWDYEGRASYAVSQGWFATAERVLEALPESVEHGRLLLAKSLTALFEGNLPEAIQHFDSTYELGQRIADRDTQVLALAGKARALVMSGEVERGLALHDESSAAAVCGELRPFATGIVYCMAISSCQDVGDYRRAAEWTEVANRWCDEADVSGFPGTCRLHRAEIMRLRGDWPAAELQAVAACEELSDFDRGITAGGHYEVGEIRRRRGDFAGAEEAYATANEWGRNPQPGLALLRLSEGKVDSAVAGITHFLQDVEAPLIRLRALPAQVEIAIAAGDLKTARAAAAELEQVVDSYKIGKRRAPAFDATAHLAAGRIKLSEKDWDSAAQAFRLAREEWQRVGAPYETAHARMLLGVALQRRGDEQGGAAELEGALAAFERLGARLDEERAKELLGRLEVRRTFLFTDIVDSTRLLSTFGDDKWKKLLARHDEVVRERIAETGGEVIKNTGDGFFASFGNAKAAIEAAIGIQRALDGEVFAPDVRIGVHTGGAFQAGGSSDYGGQDVHVAARIGGAASAAEILVSVETLDGVGGAFRLSEPRTESLKGIDRPVDVVSVDWR